MEYKNTVRLRAHHCLCLCFFRGRGYSGEFTENMARVFSCLQKGSACVEIVRGADDLCAFCPHNSAGTCGTESKVVRYDGRVLDLCAFSTENGESGALSGWSEIRKAVEEITRACQTMSKSRTGALIVIAPTVVAQHILDTGVELEAIVSASLLEAIFNTRAPFHDGAAIIKGNKVLAAGCFLPLSQSQTVAKNLGTRHRAGIGITEESDMLTIIVSEETGIISVAKHGELRRFVTPDRLRDILHETLKIAPQTKTRMI